MYIPIDILTIRQSQNLASLNVAEVGYFRPPLNTLYTGRIFFIFSAT